jgi:hypothetical protein
MDLRVKEHVFVDAVLPPRRVGAPVEAIVGHQHRLDTGPRTASAVREACRVRREHKRGATASGRAQGADQVGVVVHDQRVADQVGARGQVDQGRELLQHGANAVGDSGLDRPRVVRLAISLGTKVSHAAEGAAVLLAVIPGAAVVRASGGCHRRSGSEQQQRHGQHNGQPAPRRHWQLRLRLRLRLRLQLGLRLRLRLRDHRHHRRARPVTPRCSDLCKMDKNY